MTEYERHRAFLRMTNGNNAVTGMVESYFASMPRDEQTAFMHGVRSTLDNRIGRNTQAFFSRNSVLFATKYLTHERGCYLWPVLEVTRNHEHLRDGAPRWWMTGSTSGLTVCGYDRFPLCVKYFEVLQWSRTAYDVICSLPERVRLQYEELERERKERRA